jgi:hypothetical protein
MLTDLRFVIGAVLATAFLAVNFLGLFATGGSRTKRK